MILTVTPFVAVNVIAGAKALNKELIDMAYVFKARRGLLIRKVILWQMMPYIFPPSAMPSA